MNKQKKTHKNQNQTKTREVFGIWNLDIIESCYKT